jgi:hypothetical protein
LLALIQATAAAMEAVAYLPGHIEAVAVRADTQAMAVTAATVIVLMALFLLEPVQAGEAVAAPRKQSARDRKSARRRAAHARAEQSGAL